MLLLLLFISPVYVQLVFIFSELYCHAVVRHSQWYVGDVGDICHVGLHWYWQGIVAHDMVEILLLYFLLYGFECYASSQSILPPSCQHVDRRYLVHSKVNWDMDVKWIQ